MNKKITLFFSVFFFFFSSLFAEEEDVVVIDSCKANYDGKQIVLSGDVVVEQKLGKIYANHIVLTPEEGKKKLRFVHLTMDDSVKVELEGGGRFLCSHADLDYLDSTGKFTGNFEQEYVIYTENCAINGEKIVPILFKSRKMDVQLTKEDPKSLKNSISEITALQNVTLNYNHDFIASSDRAVYQRIKNEEEPKKNPGRINLSAASQHGMCQITNKNGDLIRATKIDIDSEKKDLAFTFPRGFLSLSDKEDTSEKIHFESDMMHWNEQFKTLTFTGNISIHQKNYGELQSEQEVKIYYEEIAGKKKVILVESLDETVIAHIDHEKKLIHTLTSYGKVAVDHILQKTTIESPRDINGYVSDGMQVYFNDILGEIYADCAVLDYVENDGTICLEKLTLEGNIRILNRSTVNPEESEAFLQYALADVVEFYPLTNEMQMTSSSTSRVLFYDKANNLQISAPSVKIKRDQMTKKESIQGFGDVRFSLEGHELEKLKNHFSLEPAKGNPL